MWILILVIVAFFIARFVYDSVKQSSEIRSDGGIRTKYKTLIEHLLNGHERCRILQDTNTFVSVGIIGPAGSQIYHIYPSFGKVTIQMEIKNNPLFGKMKMDWTFPENMNQEEMVYNINKGIENKVSSMYNGIL